MRHRNRLYHLMLVIPFLLAACADTGPDSTGQTSQEMSGRHQWKRPATLFAALGASVTYGIGSTNEIGFVKPFRWYLMFDLATHGRIEWVHLDNAAVPGATSDDIINDQLQGVLDEIPLYKHGTVALVGSDGGGNDLRGFLNSPDFAICFQPDQTECFMRIGAILQHFYVNFATTVGSVRAAIGPDAPLIVTTQYNPMLKSACDPSGMVGPLASGVFEGPNGFNDVVRAVAAQYGAIVVDTFYPLAADPENLINDDCIHPNDAGYAVIFNQLVDTWEANY
ncbi:MAG: hypothetical protein J7M25_17760 [Deltaproteobacteria bacterium]|nr:hypothetical protein [Deltaproteobacteria bacterium]